VVVVAILCEWWSALTTADHCAHIPESMYPICVLLDLSYSLYCLFKVLLMLWVTALWV